MIKRYLANTWFFPRYIGRKYMLQKIFEAREYAHGTILDIGCGMRPYEAILRENSTNYIGIDLPVFPYLSRQDITGDAVHLPFKGNTFNTVLAFELMEHLQSPTSFLEEVARVLKNGGALILSVPFMEPLHEEPRDFYRFTPYSLQVLLERQGFSIKYIRARGNWWSVVIGSFIPQAIYELANPLDQNGQRSNRMIPTLFILPFCALFQIIGYNLDRITANVSKYTLGYFVVAIRNP